jgi:hypothetical protein
MFPPFFFGRRSPSQSSQKAASGSGLHSIKLRSESWNLPTFSFCFDHGLLGRPKAELISRGPVGERMPDTQSGKA